MEWRFRPRLGPGERACWTSQPTELVIASELMPPPHRGSTVTLGSPLVGSARIARNPLEGCHFPSRETEAGSRTSRWDRSTQRRVGVRSHRWTSFAPNGAPSRTPQLLCLARRPSRFRHLVRLRIGRSEPCGEREHRIDEQPGHGVAHIRQTRRQLVLSRWCHHGVIAGKPLPYILIPATQDGRMDDFHIRSCD